MRFLALMICFAVLATFGVACGNGTSVSPASAESPGASAQPDSTQAKKSPGDPYPTFTRGGALTLTVQGQQVTVPINDVFLQNTDSGYPDFLEISGNGTYLCGLIDPKMPDGEGDTNYKPLVGRALPLKVPDDLADGAREITIPNQGKYPVTGGNLTMDKFQVGMDGRDFWEGHVEVVVQTSQGPISLPGTFKLCVVPVW